MKKYSAIANYIKQNYSSVISRIYRNSLNSLIAVKGRHNHSKNKYSMVSKAEKSFGLSKIAEENVQNYETMLNYVTKAAYKTKRLQPNKQIVAILNNAEHTFGENDRFYVLPQINDNGVVLKQNKSNMNFLEAQFELISEADAMAIENYMLETANSLDKKTAASVKAQIVKIFEASKKAGREIKDGSNPKLVEDLTQLTANLVDLVGVDLSSFEKKSVARSQRGTTVTEKEVVDSQMQTEVQATVDPTTQNTSANEILIRGTFKTGPALEGDVIVTKLTPDGVKFSVSFDGNKLFVSNEKQEESTGMEM